MGGNFRGEGGAAEPAEPRRRRGGALRDEPPADLVPTGIGLAGAVPASGTVSVFANHSRDAVLVTFTAEPGGGATLTVLYGTRVGAISRACGSYAGLLRPQESLTLRSAGGRAPGRFLVHSVKSRCRTL